MNEDKLAASAAYGKVDYVSAYPKSMIPRITIRDHADVHALINAMELARHTLAGTRDEVERTDWHLLGELLEAAQKLHTEMIVEDVTKTVRKVLADGGELGVETAQQIAFLHNSLNENVHPFHD